jgi:GSH-dependent disulfide-bond oxidoreductase
MTDTDYAPPKVWTWNRPNGGELASLNRLTDGPMHEKRLPDIGLRPSDPALRD